MTKIDSLRRFILPCCSSPATNSTIKKRLTTSLLDSHGDTLTAGDPLNQEQGQDSVSPDPIITANTATLPQPRPSRTMVIGTIFGHRHGHVWFCVQHNRLAEKPLLLLELSVSTHLLVKEMNCGLVRIALESARPDLTSCPLRSLPAWNMFCNGKLVGFAASRRVDEHNRLILKTIRSMTVGAGVIPAGFGSADSVEIMYMRANYEHVVGSTDSESFHLINPDECPGQELSVFLMRTR